MILTGKAAEFANELVNVMAKGEIERRELNEREQINLFTLITLYETDKAFSAFISFIIGLYSECAVRGKEKQLEFAWEMEGVLDRLIDKEG